ncbi:probable 2-oxoglutarate-dependent dioxygenase ANS [Selaginella moellendorffii]|uniref:probable 2-oxoglutarate-dependent dioxygenase ANS n=1 Tax=Selaginella moellendorffii TaxID=88036 RepID=UPI000D1CD4B2|nr:probable 2-oxoglutarate-dependent dioxygenase ANS [Selaginella moellendorffii]|eukprot:XP_024531281.1 probable 2-oxoglutarate-dependent dioxygenase ANS [Selaginella moellendorffii]
MEEGSGDEKGQAIQELLKSCPKTVPQRFVQPDGYGPRDRRCTTLGLEIPVIDMLHDRSTMLRELKEVVNHGVDMEVVRNLRRLAYEFYVMPSQEKRKWRRKTGESAGYGAFGKSSDGTSDWVDTLCMYLSPESARNVETVWPDKPELLRSFKMHGVFKVDDLLVHRVYVDEAGKQIGEYAQKLAADLSESLGLPRDHFKEVLADSVASLRLNLYPLCPFADRVLGVGAHSDMDTFTILIEESEKEGLEVLKNGLWLPVKPVISNGKYKSQGHRALVFEHSERVSIVVNYSPLPGVSICPAQELLSSSHPAMYRQSSYADYIDLCQADKSLGRDRVDSLLC